MKYDEQLFDLSGDAYFFTRMDLVDENKELSREQNEVLLILFNKFKEKIISKKDLGNGVVKVRFYSKFYTDPEYGYTKIKELMKNKEFDSFASEYCMYITDEERRCNEYCDSYIEISWDYKTYYEQLKKEYCPSVTYKNLKAVERRHNKKIKQEACAQLNGHEYGPWEKKTWTSVVTEGASGVEGALRDGVNKIEIEHSKWVRRCNNCGKVETSRQKPLELLIAEKDEEIKLLQKKLGTQKKKGH